jgi:hypothetical protein
MRVSAVQLALKLFRKFLFVPQSQLRQLVGNRHSPVLPMDLVEFLKQSAAFLVGTSPWAILAALIAKPWIEKRIDHSIAHEYAEKLALYQAKIDQQQEIRHRAALMADLLSSWLKTGTDRDELNRLSFEAFLWLPEDIAQDLSKTLAHKPDAPSVRDLIIKTRQHLLGSQDSLVPNNVIVFPDRVADRSPLEYPPAGSGPVAALGNQCKFHQSRLRR